MIDPRTLAYDFDEEAEGFGEPPRVERPRLPLDQKLCLGLLGAGLLTLVAQIGGTALSGTWGGMALSWGSIALGTSLWFWRLYAGTTPGIKHDGIWFRSALSRGALGWLAGIFMTGMYVLIYWFPQVLGESADGPPTGLVATVDPLAQLVTGYPASRWFLYGVLYTTAILVFGVRMFMKYRHSRYHQIRTASVMVFQFGFAWLLPNLLVLFQKPYMEFNGIWPLKQNYIWPEKWGEFTGAGAFGLFLLVWAVGLVVATPILTYFFGKRWYCSWVCGCGGLAETLGDPWRQLSDNSTRAWKIERWMIHSVLAAVLAVTVSLWIDYKTTGAVYGSWSGGVRQWYGFYIGAVFSGVVGVGFYPLLGNRVWCRFGCPQAAILGIWQRFYSRFRITTNGDQCMSCGNCSTYCEMGIDVRSYAQKSENIVRASCVGCGVCASVCPRGVLKLENGSTHADRYEGSDRPLDAFVKSLGIRDR
ncbi:4Fe-4S binding protein [Engelhardtia mirabilis]|uniref:Electron transport protein YccM n=1 Tax=Engelhardtia mirabilis TaxID=2528011 RepID=A0A518BQE0_9BACT|nr:Putative electron transport protein YccM [Planctomycetes bacterium Pla133]QDV03524.1 Putative electron transport protein YccM [Planctomycetes bacterium Pla86]